jgi:hypothetical protein
MKWSGTQYLVRYKYISGASSHDVCSQEVDMREDVYNTDIQDGQAKAMLPDATKTQIWIPINPKILD